MPLTQTDDCRLPSPNLFRRLKTVLFDRAGVGIERLCVVVDLKRRYRNFGMNE